MSKAGSQLERLLALRLPWLEATELAHDDDVEKGGKRSSSGHF